MRDKKKAVKTIISNVLYPVIALIIFYVVWLIAAKIKDDAFVLPSPNRVIKTFFSLGSDRAFWISVATSLLRTLICFAISFVSALLISSLAGLWKPLHKVLTPIISILRAVPTVAAILILYAFMGKNELAVAVGFLIAFPIMYSAFYTAIDGVDGDLLEMAKLYKVKAIDRIRFIYLPSIADVLFDTSKSTLSLTFKVVIAAEILVSVTGSLGGKIQAAYATFEADYLLSWTMVAIVFSFVLEGIVGMLKLIWRKKNG